MYSWYTCQQGECPAPIMLLMGVSQLLYRGILAFSAALNLLSHSSRIHFWAYRFLPPHSPSCQNNRLSDGYFMSWCLKWPTPDPIWPIIEKDDSVMLLSKMFIGYLICMQLLRGWLLIDSVWQQQRCLSYQADILCAIQARVQFSTR